MSDDEIIKGCRNRNRSAQTAFYNLFAQTMFSTACRLIGDEYEAEDIVQEVLLLPLTGKIQMLDRQADMERRLRRITINETIDRLRKQKNIWDCWEDGIDITADEGTDDMLIDAERSGNLRQAIDSLPEKYKTVLLLSVVEDLSSDDIASLLHAKPSTIRTQLTRAKQKLITCFRYEKHK